MKIQAKSNEINNWCKANNLKRDYSRELVSQQIVKKLNFTKLPDSGNIVSTKTSYGMKLNITRMQFIRLTLRNIPQI